MLASFIPLFLQILMAAGLAYTLLIAAKKLGPKRPNAVKTMAYESGMDPVGTARDRYSVKFYLVAMIFIVFDVEVVFLYPWAVTFREFLSRSPQLGLFVLGVVGVFLAVLTLGLVYDIKKGGLEF
ncbi:MAG: NADH-quinone oxidoreductase subunit A [Bacteroidetes bacterium]|nr:NADH-quinone oxidoreductase subunit A [Bacteroidota bacterium]